MKNITVNKAFLMFSVTMPLNVTLSLGPLLLSCRGRGMRVIFIQAQAADVTERGHTSAWLTLCAAVLSQFRETLGTGTAVLQVVQILDVHTCSPVLPDSFMLTPIVCLLSQQLQLKLHYCKVKAFCCVSCPTLRQKLRDPDHFNLPPPAATCVAFAARKRI